MFSIGGTIQDSGTPVIASDLGLRSRFAINGFNQRERHPDGIARYSVSMDGSA
jgi:hypothetical protein